MIFLKGCRRCGGDVVESQDQYGVFYFCIQCGEEMDDPAVAAPKPQIPGKSKAGRAKSA